MSKVSKNIDEFLKEEKYVAKKHHDAVKNLRSSEDVAQELGLTRQRVNQITQVALKKVYSSLKKTVTNETPFQIFSILVTMMNSLDNEKAIKVIFKGLDDKDQQEIIKDAIANYPNVASVDQFNFLKK